MIKGGFINTNSIDYDKYPYSPDIDIWDDKTKQFKLLNWNHPSIIMIISEEIRKKEKKIINELNEDNCKLLDFAKYFVKDKQEITDNEINTFVSFLNQYYKELKDIINSSSYDRKLEKEQKQINANCNQLLNSIGIELEPNYFEKFRDDVKITKGMTKKDSEVKKEKFKKLSELIGNLEKIKNYKQIKNKYEELKNEEKIYFDYYEGKDLETFIKKDLEIKKDVKDRIIRLMNEEYGLDKYIETYKYIMPINLYKIKEIFDILKNTNSPTAHIIIIRKEQILHSGINRIYEIYDYKPQGVVMMNKIYYEFDSDNFSIKRINLVGDEVLIKKPDNNIILYPYIKKTPFNVYTEIQSIIITGMVMSQSKKSNEVSNCILKLLEKYYVSFLETFLGTPRIDEIKYFQDYRGLFLAFVYGAKLKTLLDIFNDTSYLDIFNSTIDDEIFLNFTNFNKILNDDFLKSYREFGSKKESFLTELNKIYPDNLKELYQLINDKISKDIVVYYNYIIQQNIINEPETLVANEEQNIKKFKDNINKLNNSITYCFDIVKDYIVVKLMIGCIYYNILKKYFQKEYILGLVYSLIINYIKSNYDYISNIVNIFQINYDLVGYYQSGFNNEFDNKIYDITNLLHVLERAFPSFVGPPYFDYQNVKKIRIVGKGLIYPCVEMWLLNFIFYLIYGEERFKDMKISNSTEPNNKIRIQEINPELLPSSTKQELKDFFIKSNERGNIVYYTKNEIEDISRTDRFQAYYRSIHNILTQEQMDKLNAILKKTRFHSNLERNYFMTRNVMEQDELPGRYSFLCLILSKIFGLKDEYSIDRLLEEENFLKFYDFKKDAILAEYPNDTIIKIFKLFSTYQYKFSDDNFKLNKRDNKFEIEIENKNIDTYLHPGHGYFVYTNNFHQDQISIDYFSSIIHELDPNLNYYNYFNNKTKCIIYKKLCNNKYNFDDDVYIYDKNFFNIVANDHTIRENEIEEPEYRDTVINLLENYNTDNKIEYLNLFSNVYFKYLDKFNPNDMIINRMLDKIVSIDFDKYSKDKFNQCWLSIEDLLKQQTNINDNLIISIDNKNNKNTKNIITTSYINFITLRDIINVFNDIDKNINEYHFDYPISLYMLLLFNNHIDEDSLQKVVKYLIDKFVIDYEDFTYLIYFLEVVYYYKLFSYKNYVKLLNVLNNLKKSPIDINISLTIVIIIMFMPYVFNLNDIGKYIKPEEKIELEKINIISYVSNLIQKFQEYYGEKHSNTIHKIYNIDILKNIFGDNFNLDTQSNLNKFIEYRSKDGKNIPIIDQKIFYLDGDGKLKLNDKEYVNYIKYLYIFNQVQYEIINQELMETFNPTIEIYQSKLILDKVESKLIFLNNQIYIDDIDIFLNDTKYVRIGSRNFDVVKVIGNKNMNQQFKNINDDYRITYSYQQTMTNEMNKVLFQDKYAGNIFNFHYVIYEKFRNICDIYIKNILTTEQLVKELFSNKNIITSELNYGEKFLCEFKENFKTKIKLVYKGGSAMKIVYEKYKKIFEKNVGLNSFIEKFKDDFLRSDADYIILIDKESIRKQHPLINQRDLDKIYNLYYYHLNFIVGILIDELRIDYQTNINFYNDFNNINYNDLDNSLDKLNEKLAKNKEDYPDSEYSKIKKFIGIYFYNRNYIKEQLDDHDLIKNLYTFKDGMLQIKPINLLNKKPNPKRMDKFITFEHKNNLSQDLIDMYQYKINVDDEFVLLENIIGNKKNDIYISINETHIYKTWENYKVNFILHRLKLNTLLYFSTDIEQGIDNEVLEERYGYINNPVEILDISIPKYDDTFNANGYDNEEYIEENIYNHPFVGKFKYYTYSSKGYIKDLYLNLCIHNKYIWDDLKYEKRLNRLIFFIITELIKLPNCIDIINNICDLLQNPTKTNLDKVKTDLKQEENNIYRFLNTIYGYTEDQEFDTFKQKYNGVISILFEKFDELRKVKDLHKIKAPTKDELDQIKYFNKYLKYKNKYNLLKNKYIK
jgi:hypothetical protein